MSALPVEPASADQKAALQVAAVLGREFSLALAGQVWDGSVPVEAQLQELKRLEFLREQHGTAERAFVFKHALTREVAYDGMLQARRRDLHGRAAAALERSQANRFEHGELLAYHYSRGADPGRALPHLAAAGDRARDRFANEEAAASYRRAAELIEELGRDRWAGTRGQCCRPRSSCSKSQCGPWWAARFRHGTPAGPPKLRNCCAAPWTPPLTLATCNSELLPWPAPVT